MSTSVSTTAIPTSTNFTKFVRLLEELFMFDQADLDFGIYRIMNAKRDEITQFLRKDLLPQVRDTLASLQSGDRRAIEEELGRAEEAARQAGFNPEDSPRVKELLAKLDATGGSLDAVEAEIFSDLYNFFRRYYQEGDFISQRRYKEGVYAIPYEGEEVKLYWANHDQYYIKSSENFRNYSFKLADGKRVTFKLVDADTERDNNRAATGSERRFMLCEDQPLFVKEAAEELIIRFEYRPDGDRRKQETLNRVALEAILNYVPAPGESDAKSPEGNPFSSWQIALMVKAPTAANPERTLLERHLTEYTARNTFDYFIHKDLGGFLRRELDFFIKNEIVHLDDIENEEAPRVEQYLAKVKAIRRIAHKIIDLLAQIENFQKKLWTKKSFVIETNYFISIDRVPESLFPQIALNDSQRDEWKVLYGIDRITRDTTGPGYSVPLTVEFLRAHPALVIDTRHFDSAFTDAIIQSFPDFHSAVPHLLINAENSHAISLLSAASRESIDHVFIDPPYNTGVDGFPYKDTYQHSSWLTMISERLLAMRTLLSPRALFFCAIDYVEVSKLRLLCDEVMGNGNFLADIAWEKRYTRSNNAKRFYSLKDTILCYRATDELATVKENRTDKSKENYTNPDKDPRGPWISSSYVNPADKVSRPNLVYEIIRPVDGKPIEHETHAWKYDRETHRGHVADNRLYWGLDGRYEYPRLKSFLSEASEGMVPVDLWGHVETGTTDDGGNSLKALFGRPVFDNPKPVSLVTRTLQLCGKKSGILSLDFFAGSGTSGQAVLEANRLAEGSASFILCEMGSQCDEVIAPRLKKVAYAEQWSDGIAGDSSGVSVGIKYIRLESYEDCLNNLYVCRLEDQGRLLEDERDFREDYLLRYMLTEETAKSPSLLNVQQFADPFNYKLAVGTGSVGETRELKVDLVETFNWLLGLRVKHIDKIRGVRVVEGTNPAGDKVLVLWRNVADVDNEVLDAWFARQGYNTRDQEYSVVYVNGDNNLENLRLPDQTWKVRLIEEDFHRLMFDVADR